MGGMSQSFDVGIERVPRFGAVKLSGFLLSLSGWLVLGLLVAGGVVWQAPMRAMRYTLIVASTEHEFSTGCCRVVYPDLPDAEKRRYAAAALSGRFLLSAADGSLGGMSVGDRTRNLGLRNTQRSRILATPRYKPFQVAGRKAGCSTVVGAHRLRDAAKETGLTSGVQLGTVRGCHLNGGGQKKVTDAAASGCDHIAGK